MPTTSVAKSSGATIVRISRRKTWPTNRSETAEVGEEVADGGADDDGDQNPEGERSGDAHGRYLITART